MRRSIATLCMSGTLRDKLEAAAAARFEAVELCEPDFIAFRGTPREVRSIADDLGIGIDLYRPFRDANDGIDLALPRALDRAERKFDLMAELGAPMLAVPSAMLSAAAGDAGRATEQLQTLAERAARRNLRVAVEASPDGQALRGVGDVWALVQRASHPHLGLLLDSYQVLSTGGDLSEIRNNPGNRIFFVRIGDARRPGWNGVRGAFHRNFPGQGDLDLVGFLEQVLYTGYAGTLSLASFDDALRATPSRRIGIDGMRALLFLESQVRSRLQQARTKADGGQAADRILDTVELFDPPKPSPFGGIAFIEFGVHDDEAVRLGSLLEQLGFTRFGRHRSKAVTLYRQGDIRFAVNAEPAADARGRFTQEPACVCSLGLLTDDPARAASRARALLSARQDTPRGAQEMELPTILAPGGTMIQFVRHDQPVEVDFVEQPAGSSAAGGLDLVDHVALGLTLEQVDTWILFTRAVLALTAGDGGDGAEPFGLMRGVGVTNDAHRVRMLLNVSTVHSTGPGRQPEGARNGPVVDSIALGCRDIFATVQRLRGNGVSFVPIAGNYYDDLIAREVLDQPTVERMRGLDIVFARSGTGTYYQAYTKPFEGRFYFEIVQRTAYDGYGAINEPLRAASLEQLRQVEAWLQPWL
jgi:4-hydroxyphenylpyruvate dioxygenase